MRDIFDKITLTVCPVTDRERERGVGGWGGVDSRKGHHQRFIHSRLLKSWLWIRLRDSMFCLACWTLHTLPQGQHGDEDLLHTYSQCIFFKNILRKEHVLSILNDMLFNEIYTVHKQKTFIWSISTQCAVITFEGNRLLKCFVL